MSQTKKKCYRQGKGGLGRGVTQGWGAGYGPSSQKLKFIIKNQLPRLWFPQSRSSPVTIQLPRLWFPQSQSDDMSTNELTAGYQGSRLLLRLSSPEQQFFIALCREFHNWLQNRRLQIAWSDLSRPHDMFCFVAHGPPNVIYLLPVWCKSCRSPTRDQKRRVRHLATTRNQTDPECS